MGRPGARWGVASLILAALVLGGGGALLLGRALAWPDDAGAISPDSQAGLHVQSILAQLFLREAGLSSRQDPLPLSAAEVNAFLSGHVEVRDPPIWPVRVQIDQGGIELGGATTLARLAENAVGRALAWAVPGPVGTYPVWITARGQVVVVSPGRAEFLVHTARIGQQQVPLGVLWGVLGGRPRALGWRMPRVVERIDVEPGRLLIHTRRPGAKSAPG